MTNFFREPKGNLQAKLDNDVATQCQLQRMQEQINALQQANADLRNTEAAKRDGIALRPEVRELFAPHLQYKQMDAAERKRTIESAPTLRASSSHRRSLTPTASPQKRSARAPPRNGHLPRFPLFSEKPWTSCASQPSACTQHATMSMVKNASFSLSKRSHTSSSSQATTHSAWHARNWKQFLTRLAQKAQWRSSTWTLTPTTISGNRRHRQQHPASSARGCNARNQKIRARCST